MENEFESPAQDPNAPDGQQEETAEQKESKRNEGVEKRIAELTAVIHDERRKNEVTQGQLNAALTAGIVNRNQPPPEDPFKDVDPSIRGLVEGITNKLKQDLGAQNAALQARLDANDLANGARSITLKVTGSAEIAEEAAQFAAQMRRRNLPINEEDASDFAIGQAVRKGTYKPGQAAQAQQQRGAPPLTGNRHANVSPQRQQAALPRNYDSLSPDEQLAIHEKNGTGDQPL